MPENKDFDIKHNPYDFANPVTKSDLFAGRKSELNDIDYYISEAIEAPRPMNLAILGPRAAGKTSMLNIIENKAKAKKHNLPVARVDLNEDAVKSHMAFFFELFDAIFDAACKHNKSPTSDEPNYAFEGQQGRTYETYITMISDYEVPERKEWRPFIFPAQYARAKNKGIKESDWRVSVRRFKQDLQTINQEVDKPVVVLFDECDVLTDKRELLEMLRNIFMNTPGFMLVFAGLPNLFPLMNDVFSPIIRQFKKIDLGPFHTVQETKECISGPLKSIDLEPIDMLLNSDYLKDMPDEIKKRSCDKTFREIHDLCGGKPYEIRLVCHFMLKRVQQGRAKRMILNTAVLDDVLLELEKEQDVGKRKVLTALRETKQKYLETNSFLSRAPCDSTIEEAWEYTHVFQPRAGISRKEFYSDANRLKDQDIIEIHDDDTFFFAGDDFDKIYAKYFCRDRRVSLEFNESDTLSSLQAEIKRYVFNENQKHNENREYEERYEFLTLVDHLALASSTKRARHFYPSRCNFVEIDLQDLCNQLYKNCESHDPYAESPQEAMAMLGLILSFPQKNRIPLVDTKLHYRENNIRVVWCPYNELSFSETDSLQASLRSLAKRFEDVNGSLAIEKTELGLGSLEALCETAIESQDKSIISIVLSELIEKLKDAYFASEGESDANLGDLLRDYVEHITDPPYCNDLGYYFLVKGDHDIARRLLDQGGKNFGRSTNPSTHLLLTYNLAMLELFDNNIGKSLEYLKECKKLSKKAEDLSAGCLILPKSINGELIKNEVWDADAHFNSVLPKTIGFVSQISSKLLE